MTGEPPLSPYAPPRAVSNARRTSSSHHRSVVVVALLAGLLELYQLILVTLNVWQFATDEPLGPFATQLLALERFTRARIVLPELAFFQVAIAIELAGNRARILGAQGFRFGRRASAWLWVPLVQLWLPYRVFAENLRASCFESDAPQEWRRLPVPPALPTWWILAWSAIVGKVIALVYVESVHGATNEFVGWLVSALSSLLTCAALSASVALSAHVVDLWRERGAEADALLARQAAAERRRRGW
jgi:hypothetical protein